MKAERMFERWKQEVGYDDDDGEVEERVFEYLNEGQMQLALKRLDGDVSDLQPIIDGQSEPDPRIPEFIHPAIVTYAVYLWFNAGNLVKQQRGQGYLMLFNTMKAQMLSLRDEEIKRAGGGVYQFRNLYT